MSEFRKHDEVTAEEFIAAWQRGTSAPQVAAQFGMTRETASMRASRYRKRGIPLKWMRSAVRQPFDIAALARLAQECAK